jgi:hypothetical protein
MGRGGKRRSGSRPHPYSDGPGVMSREQARRQMEETDAEFVPFIRGREIDAGDLSGDVVEPVMASFTYFGKRFRVNPDLTETMVVDLLEAGEGVEVNDPSQLTAVKHYAEEHLHPEDFEEFWETAKRNRQSIQAVIKVCWKLLEQVTERPTTPPSDSSDGRPATATSSAAGASAPVIESDPVVAKPYEAPAGNVREVAAPFVEKYERIGRPDLANQVMLAVETREARGLVTV